LHRKVRALGGRHTSALAEAEPATPASLDKRISIIDIQGRKEAQARVEMELLSATRQEAVRQIREQLCCVLW
jgi:hypothetical protein